MSIRVRFGVKGSFRNWRTCANQRLQSTKSSHHGRPVEICGGLPDGGMMDGTKLFTDIFQLRDRRTFLFVTYTYPEGTRDEWLDDFLAVCDSLAPDG